MISISLFIVSFFILGTIVNAFKFSSYKNAPYTEDDYKTGKLSYRSDIGKSSLNIPQIIKTIVVLFLSFIIAAIQPIGIQRIDAGNIGLKIDRIGNNKGIPVARPVKGWVFYNNWTTDVVEYSIRQNHVSYKDFTVTTKGGFPMKVSPSFNYSLKPEKAVDLYINLLKGGSFNSLEDNFLNTATALALNNASNKYPIDSIFNNKEGYNAAVAQELNRELSAYFIVTQINPGSVPPPELADIIKSKTETIQKAQRAELDKITAKAEAETKIIRSRGDSAAVVIAAQAAAEEIKIKQREITPTYVEFIKWNTASPELPRVPSTVLGSSSVLLSK